MTQGEKSEATIFFADQIIHEMKVVIAKQPNKATTQAYMSAWLNIIETIKGLNE